MPDDSPAVQLVPSGGWDDRVRVFQYGRLVTSFAVISRRYVVLLDTLHNPREATSIVKLIEPQLRDGRQLLVINTHADWDHCWGNAVFAGSRAAHPAPIFAHRLCRERMRGEDARAGLAEMQRESPATFGDVTLAPPTIAFDDSLTIDGGDLTFELIPTPGHQPDHISVFVPEIKTLFVGDAAEQPIPYLADLGTLPLLRESLARLMALDAKTALYCHAPGVTTPMLIRENIAYFDEVERWARDSGAAEQPAAWADESADLEALIDFGLADVNGIDALDEELRAAYHDNHRRAIRAMLGWIAGESR